MATIHNSDLTKELKEGGKLQQLRDVIPSQLADKVVPVMEVNPKLLRRINYISARTTTGTIMTTDATKDFFITNISLSASNKTAAQDTLISVSGTPKGFSSSSLGQINFSTSALIDVGHGEISIAFSIPILMERNSTITTTMTNCSVARATIFGYYVDNTTA